MKTAYEDLPLLPNLVAEQVASVRYTGLEWEGISTEQCEAIERKRRMMTPEQIREFADLCDKKCKMAYEAKAKWFLRCLKGNVGRNQLYVWISHWLASYLKNPGALRRFE